MNRALALNNPRPRDRLDQSSDRLTLKHKKFYKNGQNV